MVIFVWTSGVIHRGGVCIIWNSPMAMTIIANKVKAISKAVTEEGKPMDSRYQMDTLRIGNPIDGFDIQPFLRRILEDEYSPKENRQTNRYCFFFAHLLKEITQVSRHVKMDVYSGWWNEELANLEMLLFEALHSVNEDFELCFDIAYNAEFFIVNLLPKDESVMFFEAMLNASKRHSKLQHGIMLSLFGEVLRFVQTRISEAYEQYMKSLDILVPLGDSRDLAWLYNHIACIWLDKGNFKQSERYFKLSTEMLHHEVLRLKNFEYRPRIKHCKICAPQKQCENCLRRHDSNNMTPWLRQEHLWTDSTLAHVLSSLGIMYQANGQYKLAIVSHEEAMHIRRRIFGLHPTLGQGYNNLCIVYEEIQDYEKAYEYVRKGLNVKTMLVTRRSNTVLVSLLNLANIIFKYQGNASKALNLLDEAYQIRTELGLKHHLTAVIHMYRGKMLVHLEKFDQAAESCAYAVRAFREEKGLRPRQMSESLRHWSVALKNLDRLDEAEKRLCESLKIIEKVADQNGTPVEDEDNFKESLRELRDVRAIIESRLDRN